MVAGYHDQHMTPVETVLAFMEAINRHDIDQLVVLMAEDHVFIDSLGNSMEGREKMRAGWLGYFAFCPDYQVSQEEIFARGDTVAVFGAAAGTISTQGELRPENRWRIPAAWRGVVRGSTIQTWQVYADNKPVYDILSKPARSEAK